MKNAWLAMFALAWLCHACPVPADVASAVRWQASDTLEIMVDGKVFRGTWQRTRCFTAQCRGPYRNVARHDRRHVLSGAAHLVAADGLSMECRWIEYRSVLEGRCEGSGGQVVELSR